MAAKRKDIRLKRINSLSLELRLVYISIILSSVFFGFFLPSLSYLKNRIHNL